MKEITNIISAHIGADALKGSFLPHHRLLVIKEGAFEAACEGCGFILSQGDALLVPPFQFLSAISKKADAAFLLLTFEGEAGSDSPKAFSLPPLLSQALFDFYQQAELLPLAALALMQQNRSRALLPIKEEGELGLFLKAAGRLQADLVAAPSVDELAESLRISLSKLKRLFSRYAGIGAHEFLAELRIARAKQLLQSGHSVTETAALCGFANQAYFSAAFKKIAGSNPKDYAAKGPAPERSAPKKEAPQKKESRKSDMPSYLL